MRTIFALVLTLTASLVHASTVTATQSFPLTMEVAEAVEAADDMGEVAVALGRDGDAEWASCMNEDHPETLEQAIERCGHE